MDLPDSPRKIALGVALGTALDFLPIPIVSIPVSFVLAKLVRVNAAAAVLTVIFFKWAVPFFFAFNYFVGKAILGEGVPQAADQPVSLVDFSAWVEWMGQLGYPFMLGAAVNSMAAAVVAYFTVKALLECRQKKRRPLSV
ncbi:MAG: DUF2062 domain-containing protein [Peptococcaceae bacterium]|nr:DUF2062 domain-containing protein [Peptococcaceae bacterium]